MNSLGVAHTDSNPAVSAAAVTQTNDLILDAPSRCLGNARFDSAGECNRFADVQLPESTGGHGLCHFGDFAGSDTIHEGRDATPKTLDRDRHSMPIIEALHLTKTYRVTQKKEGLLGAPRGLYRRESKEGRAVEGGW